MFMNGVTDLSPTLLTVNNKFSVKYFLHIIILDENKRKYFKQAEIKLYRTSI